MTTKKPAKTKKPDKSPKATSPKNESRVEIKPAKGRPMLTWVGKKPLRHAIAYPAQLVESFNARVGASHDSPLQKTWSDWPKDLPQTGLLFHGDNKDVLAYLLANGFRGTVKLIYIDPPFDSGADYIRKVNLRGIATNLEGEGYAMGEQIQYTDIWTNDNYLQFLFQRLLMLKELLHEEGSIWVHLDWRRSAHVRLMLDEIFGTENFVNEVIWHYKTFQGQVKSYFARKHDNLLLYKRGDKFSFRQIFDTDLEETIDYERWKDYIDENGNILGGNMPTQDSRFMRYLRKWKEGKGRDPEKNEVVYQLKGQALDSVWEFKGINPNAGERTDYPTQKPEPLIKRIIETATGPNDLVLDCFIGSGTTAAVAQKLGRRWIGADINKGAIQTSLKRLQSVIQEQVESTKSKTQALPGMEAEETPAPAQLGFSVYRVNDYDLQIQHNEAFNLAVEHLGMTRTKTDAFFDGTLGRKLVKIVPFNHPVTPLDLEEVKKELNNRPEEERDIVVVGLGKEVAVEAWLDEWNKLRKQGNIPNKIEVIELRSDPKYGGFFTHEPAKAKVSFKRVDKGVEITIDDFISPTILERLRQQNKDNPLFQPQVSDWRSMVDSVMIDSAYDGKVFNITLADVPEKKNDLVVGKYVVEAKKGAVVAVKVTDMLGEEVLVVGEE
ncbi:MAG: site-specific DNA-methyltransferase [Chloroflexi bacterium]|nr:site-specific DNA-methyltransferase [Chloroflexota bacterium]